MVFSHLRPLLGLLRLSKLPSGPFEAAGPSEPEDVPKASLLYSPLLQEAHNGLYKVLSYSFSANLITDRQPIGGSQIFLRGLVASHSPKEPDLRSSAVRSRAEESAFKRGLGFTPRSDSLILSHALDSRLSL